MSEMTWSEHRNDIVVSERDNILASFASKNRWRSIFDFAPGLLGLSKEYDGKDLYDSFLDYADQQGFAMNWRLHLHLLDWLYDQVEWKSKVNAPIVKECLIAAVTRWSLNGLDHVGAKGLLVASPYWSGRGVGIWKSREAESGGKVVVLQLPLNIMPMASSYVITHTYDSWEEFQWVSVYA